MNCKLNQVFLVLFFMISLASFTQVEIVANPGEYIPAENYGGKVELKRFIKQEMNYPQKALNDKTQGTVILEFVVDRTTGKTSQLKINQSVSKEIDKEAIRLYKMLLFKPSFYKGDEITTYRSLNIKFSVNKYKRYCKKRGYNEIIYSNDMDTSFIVYQENQVDTAPQIIFENKDDNIATFLTKNLKYPEGTRRLNITGIVKLSFVVEPTGRITNIKVVRNVGGGATNETIRLLKLLSWKPAIKANKKVRVLKNFEVDYNLTNDSGYDYVPTSY